MEPAASNIRLVAQDSELSAENLDFSAYGIPKAISFRDYRSAALDSATVDTLGIYFKVEKGFVRPDHRLTVKRSPNGANRLLWQDDAGGVVEGEKAFWNGEGISVEVSALSKDWHGAGSIGCRVHFSLPSFPGCGSHDIDNTWPLPRRIVGPIFDHIQQVLDDIGLNCNVRQAQICRCDLNRNLVLDEPLENYASVQRLLTVPRTQRWKCYTTEYNGNKSQVIMEYDKKELLKAQGRPTKHLPDYLIRREWKIMKCRNVRKKLGFSTVQELIDNWHYLSSIFNAHMQKTKFRFDATTPRRSSYDPTRAIRHDLATFRRWCQKREIEVESVVILERILRDRGIDAFNKALKAKRGMNAQRAARLVRQLREALFLEAMQDADFARRYAELKKKSQGGQCWPYIP